MKMVQRELSGRVIVVWISLAVIVTAATAGEFTALKMVQQANQLVGSNLTDKVLQVQSERSTNGLTPKTWTVMYYDATARAKTAIVTLARGKAPKVARPFQLFKRPDPRAIFELSKVKIDSDAALKVAQKDRLLDQLKLTSSRITLERWEEDPVWKIEFWAEKAHDPGKTANVGQIFVNSQDGTIVNRNLQIDRVE